MNLRQIVICLYLYSTSYHVLAQQEWQPTSMQLSTRWSKQVSPGNVLPEYPRPQMIRSQWQNLNGLWDYAITGKDSTIPEKYEGRILVPFPLESGLSGVKKTLQPDQFLWYRKIIPKPALKKDERLLLHFGAVDWQATIFVNNRQVGGHTGGYQDFSLDITDALRNGDNELVVKVYDPTDQGPNPRGKQSLHPGGIMYTPSSGIWQTVWLETVPAVYINDLYLTPDVDSNRLTLQVNLSGNAKDYVVEAIAGSNGNMVGSVKVSAGQAMKLPISNAHLWSPDDPFLYDLSIRLWHNGKLVDTVRSYFGMRKIAIAKDKEGIERIFLNNKYTFNLGVLDQGFWPDGIYTAPTDEALKFDIQTIKDMGFNTIRKHIKLEPARWYYYCDKLGMLVWQDMPFCSFPTEDLAAEAKAEFEKENAENIRELHNYPSIVCWVLFNEGWNSYDQKRLTAGMKQADPSRLVDGHTGENYCRNCTQNVPDKWGASDMTDIHDYPGPGIPPSLAGKARALGRMGRGRSIN